MSQATIEELQTDLATVRQELAALRSYLAPAAPPEPESYKVVGEALERELKLKLEAKEKTSGLSVGNIITQIRHKNGSGTAYSVIALLDAADLPTEEQIAEKVARLSVFAQNPLILRALRCLAEPYFEAQPMRRFKADLAASLNVEEAEVEAALIPLLDRYNLRWGKDSTGQEYYEWDGNGFAMMLLIHG